MGKTFEELIQKAGYNRIALKTLNYAKDGYEYAENLEQEGQLIDAKKALEHRLFYIQDDLETCGFAMAVSRDGSAGDFHTPGMLIGKAHRIYASKIKDLSEKLKKTE